MIVDRSEQNWTPLAGLGGLSGLGATWNGCEMPSGLVDLLGTGRPFGDQKYQDPSGKWNPVGTYEGLLCASDGWRAVSDPIGLLGGRAYSSLAEAMANIKTNFVDSGPSPQIVVNPQPDVIFFNPNQTPIPVVGGSPASVINKETEGSVTRAMGDGVAPYSLSQLSLPSFLTDKYFGIPTWLLITGGVIGVPLISSALSGRRG